MWGAYQSGACYIYKMRNFEIISCLSFAMFNSKPKVIKVFYRKTKCRWPKSQLSIHVVCFTIGEVLTHWPYGEIHLFCQISFFFSIRWNQSFCFRIKFRIIQSPAYFEILHLINIARPALIRLPHAICFTCMLDHNFSTRL